MNKKSLKKYCEFDPLLKHSGASVATIHIYGSSESVDLEISDDGKGFKRKDTLGGLGLKTIYTRAEAVGGKGHGYLYVFVSNETP